MQLILDHVKSYGYFEPPQFKGGYDILPFTHEEYHAYVKTLQKQPFFETSVADITVHVRLFKHEGEIYVLRHMEMGEWIDALMTESTYRKWLEDRLSNQFVEPFQKELGYLNDTILNEGC